MVVPVTRDEIDAVRSDQPVLWEYLLWAGVLRVELAEHDPANVAPSTTHASTAPTPRPRQPPGEISSPRLRSAVTRPGDRIGSQTRVTSRRPSRRPCCGVRVGACRRFREGSLRHGRRLLSGRCFRHRWL